MNHGFTFRPGTQDEEIFNYMLAGDEYHLPSAFNPDDIIIDVGMHIGTFSYKALMLGSNKVYGFEAEPSNFECAKRNLAQFGDRVDVQQKGVWRSDRKTNETLHFIYSLEKRNTGGGNVLGSNGGPGIESIALDDVIDQVTNRGRKRVRMLKIDCEGSEFTILMTSRRLHLIDEISGEYHEFSGDYDTNQIPPHARVPGFDRFSIQELTNTLTKAGFEVTSTRHSNTHLGLFHAVNRKGRVYRQDVGKTGLRSAWHSLKRMLKAS